MADDDASCLIFHLKSVISSSIRTDTPLWELVPFRKIFMRFLGISCYIFLPSFVNLLHCIQGLNVIVLNYPELFYWVQNWFHAKKILIKKSSAQENNIIYIRSPCSQKRKTIRTLKCGLTVSFFFTELAITNFWWVAVALALSCD